MHNALRVAGILAFAFGLFLAYDGVSGFGGPTTTSSASTTSGSTSSTTSTVTYTGTDSSTTYVAVTVTNTVTAACTYPAFGQAVVTVTVSTTTTTSTSCLPPSYAGTLTVTEGTLVAGQSFHFSGKITNNGIGIAAGGAVLELMTSPNHAVIAVGNAYSDGSFDLYAPINNAGTYSVFVYLPDGHVTNSVTVTATPWVIQQGVPQLVQASSASLKTQPNVYWSAVGFAPNDHLTLTVTNIATGNSFGVGSGTTNSMGAASGSFTATSSMVGSNKLVVSSSSVNSYTVFSVSSGYTYAQSVLGVSGTGLYAEAGLGVIMTVAGIMLFALGSRKKSL